VALLVLVRHGESTANRDHLVPGRLLDVELTDLGVQQAHLAAERVCGLARGQVRVVSSDAQRAHKTAAMIASRLGGTIDSTELLREQYLGDLEGRPVCELTAEPVPAGFDISEVNWGGGESIAQVHRRMRRLLDELAGWPNLPQTVVLVGHGHAFAVLLAVLAGRGHRDVDWVGDALPLGGVRAVEWQAGTAPPPRVKPAAADPQIW